MSQNLVIVESPAKGKTIEKFLGPDFKVLASFGHVRALPSKQGSVDIEKDFEPKYHVLPESKKHLDAIKAALKGADRLLLATDPDREGEAISWHLLAALGLDKKNPGIKIQRVEFHEITKEAILHAVKNPRDIALDLVNAQQARSILDYLVGFNLSPFLWKKSATGFLPAVFSRWRSVWSVNVRRRSWPSMSRSTGLSQPVWVLPQVRSSRPVLWMLGAKNLASSISPARMLRPP